MTGLFVDTSVWSLALRRDREVDDPRLRRLADALREGEDVETTGVVLQELLQGTHSPKQRTRLVDHFRAFPFLVPDVRDHLEAAELRNRCRRKGIQLATVDALLAGMCTRRNLTMLTADRDFQHAATVTPLRIWSPA